MKVVVIGSGVVGVASAWYLSLAGHDVVVVDRQPGSGMETSFANAGQVSPGYSAPWAGPGLPLKALKWLLMRHRPFVIWPLPDPALWSWLSQALANCTEGAYRVNKDRMVRLAEYSRDRLRDLRSETGISYDDRQRGTLQLFRTEEQLSHAGDDTRVLAGQGVPFELLDPRGCVEAEPALGSVRGKFVGGLRLPGDETGDALLFTRRLAELASRRGVRFLHSVTVLGFATEGGRIAGAMTDAGAVVGDAYVVAMGSFSRSLLAQVGVRAPIYPVKGYSITVPITDPEMAPVSTVMDETYKVAITRLGDRIRVGGTAELAGYSASLRRPRRETLEHSVRDLFPRGGDVSAASFWTGLRPMTPDGTPIVGPTSIPNLWTNTGHGTLGWTMACGSGKVLADLMSGTEPDIEHGDLAVSRYA